MFQSVRETLYHFINGIYSGIPLCCVMFFLRYHNTYPEGLSTHTLAKRGFPYSNGYVECDECHKRGHFVKVRKNGAICRPLIFTRSEIARIRGRKANLVTR